MKVDSIDFANEELLITLANEPVPIPAPFEVSNLSHPDLAAYVFSSLD